MKFSGMIPIPVDKKRETLKYKEEQFREEGP